MGAADPSAGVLELGVVLLLAAVLGRGARAAGLPAVIGYLAVGLLVSPFTPGFVADREQLDLLGQIGVALLLFEVGIEVDPLSLRRSGRHLVWVVPLHTVGLMAAASLAAAALGLPRRGALLVGLAVTLSSSVVVVNITRSPRRATNDATGQSLLGWSVVQDVTGVVLAAGVLALVGVDGRPAWEALLGIVGFAVLAAVAALVLPRVLRRLQEHPDLFLLLSVAGGLSLAGIGERVFGVPLALSAFVAGLAISESPVTSAARERLLPFRDLFAVLFFVAVGSLIDPSAIPASLGWLALVLGLVLVVKGGSIAGLMRLLRPPDVTAWRVGAGLGQIGEFSFVIASLGVSAGLITQRVHTAILGAMVLTIAFATLVTRRVRAAGPA